MRGALAIAAATFALAACAATRAIPPTPTNISDASFVTLASLPGWQDEDHVAALAAVKGACAVSRDPALSRVCAAAAALDFLDEDGARRFLESNFRAEPVGEPGRLTGYFMPVYDASFTPTEEFTAPVRPKPIDLPPEDLSANARAPYADRAAIDARPADDVLAWMRPEDLFFMQIQGSGVLDFPDGSRRKAEFAGDNGAPFVGVAASMRQQGLIAGQAGSAGAIHDWLAAHRGAEADRIMALDPRYVFFSLTSDDGRDPFGAAGSRLVGGRSVAVDPTWHAMGELLWLSADAPSLAGAWPAYRRLVVALDTGGAIKGPARADLYVGRGPAAGQEAGRILHTLTLYRLVPDGGDGG